MGIIFDLDQTLIDSQSLENLRRTGQWTEVYRGIPGIQPFQGIEELICDLEKRSILFGIVTSSPASYCNRIIKHLGWKFSFNVCYHDTQRRKPHPEPIELAIQKLQVPQNAIISIGDDSRDIVASKKAGVLTVGALWGAQEPQKLIDSNPDYLCSNVEELIHVINQKYN